MPSALFQKWAPHPLPHRNARRLYGDCLGSQKVEEINLSGVLASKRW